MVEKIKPSLFRRVLGLAEPGGEIVKNEVTFNKMPIPKHTIMGSPGTEIYSGYVAEEYLSSLRNAERCLVYDQMRRSDSQVKMCLSAVKGQIKRAKWTVEPASPDDGVDEATARADADLISQILFKDISFKKFLHEALLMLDFGVSPFEITHKVVLNHAKLGSYISLRQLGWRAPKTIQTFNVDKESQLLKSITQWAYGDLDVSVEIPAEYLLMFVMDQEGANYEGISMLRPLYGNWFRKNIYQKLNAVGIEKNAVPAALGKYPPGAQGTTAYSKFVEVLQAYTSHQSQYITVPNDFEIELVANAYDPQKTESSIDNEDKRMVKGFLANFLELGMNGSGSYALSNDISDFFLSGLDGIADVICEPFNLNLIPSLIQLNRGTRAAYPTLKASGISDKAGKELAEIFEILSRGGFVSSSDEPTREHVRQRFNLPKPQQMTTSVVTPPPGANPGGSTASTIPSKTLAERIRAVRELKSKRATT